MSAHNHGGVCYATNLTQRTDPTHTLTIRKRFLRDIRQRFRELRGVIRTTVGYENDAFGLAENLDDTDAYDFPTDRAKIREFIEDLRRWLQEGVLEPATFADQRQGNHWTADYVRDAYLMAHRAAVGRLNQQGVSATVEGPQTLLSRPMRVNTLRDLYTRAYENLQNITSDMADTMRREITEGFAQGEHPRKIADRLTDEIRDMQRTRAETVARTEVIHAYTQGTLDEYDAAGVEAVGHGRWSAADDTRTCPFCRRLDGEAFTISELKANHAVEFRGQVYRLAPPSHPNGRCLVRPLVGFDDDLAPLAERVPGELLT